MPGPTEPGAQPWLSVVIPAYNEEGTIATTLASVREWLERHDGHYEVIVVDNASTDATVATVEGVAGGWSLRLLRNDVNHGKGYSVCRGMLEARGRLRLLCDADCGPSLVSLDAMIEQTEHADVIAGSRLASGADVGRPQPMRRRIVGWPFIALTRLIMSEPTRDIYCGFKLWRDTTAEAVFSRQHLEGWAFDAESLALARGLGYRVREHGIKWTDRPGSKLSIVHVLVPAIRELVQARISVSREVRRARSAGHAAGERRAREPMSRRS